MAKIRETAVEKAEGIVKHEALKKLGWKEEDLVQRKKGDAARVKVARRLRNETTMTASAVLAEIVVRRIRSISMNLRDSIHPTCVASGGMWAKSSLARAGNSIKVFGPWSGGVAKW